MDASRFLRLAKKSYLNESLSRPDWKQDHSRDPGQLWLDKNENTDPFLNERLFSLLKEVKPYALNTYPEAAKVYGKLAKMTGLSKGNFLLTNGSDGAIRAIFDVFVEPGDKVLHSHPTFAMYYVYSKMFDARELQFPYLDSPTGPRFDFSGFLELIRKERPKLVCLPNPDSPSGTVIGETNMSALISATAESGSILLIDEAYFPFYAATVLPFVSQNPHLFVARSFSKAWGAAGLRVGFLAGQPSMMEVIHKNRPMYEVGALSMELLHLLLDHEAEVRASVDRLLSGKRYFTNEMRSLGFTVAETNGNFVHVYFGEALPEIEAALKGAVLYRHFANAPGLRGFTRFSLGTEEQFKKVVNLIKGVVK